MTPLRFALLSLILFGLAPALTAEETENRKGAHGMEVFVGMKIGPGAGFAFGADNWDYEAPAPIMSLNAFLTIRVWDYLAIQLELAYEMKGYQRIDDYGVVTDRFHYVSPMLLVKGFFDVDGFELQPYAGAEIAFLQEKEEVRGSSVGEPRINNSRWLDVGVVAGFEVFFPLPVDDLYLAADVRGEVGLFDFERAATVYFDQYEEGKLALFYALVGMAYRF